MKIVFNVLQIHVKRKTNHKSPHKVIPEHNFVLNKQKMAGILSYHSILADITIVNLAMEQLTSKFKEVIDFIIQRPSNIELYC